MVKKRHPRRQKLGQFASESHWRVICGCLRWVRTDGTFRVQMSSERPEFGPHTHAGFPSTHWSVLAQAHGGGDGAGAIETLCRSYWPPVYAELRRRGLAPADAQDATQEFFASLLRRESFGSADAARGRFRAFLLGALDHFLTDRFRASTACKRGGRRASAFVGRRGMRGMVSRATGGRAGCIGGIRPALGFCFNGSRPGGIAGGIRT